MKSMHSLCRLCRSTEMVNGTCGNCGISESQTSDLPPENTQNASPASTYAAWDAKTLKRHPGTPWTMSIRESEFRMVLAKEINYRDVLDGNTSLFFWCPPDKSLLYVRVVKNLESPDNWVTIRGEDADFGVLAPGDLITIGSYSWVFHAYSHGNGFGLEPGNPLVGSTVELQDVVVGKRLNVPSLRIESGQFVGVVGKSGAGKSTLIREIVESRAGRGEVRIDGESRDQVPDPAATKIAYVPQMDVVYDELTVRQQTIDYVHMVTKNVNDDQIDEAIRVVGLEKLRDQFSSKISGGELRRMRLAAAFGRRPGVLLLDEPDSGLDPDTANDIRRLLRTFSLLGATVIMITHHRQSVVQFDRQLSLKNGKIVKDTLPSKQEAAIATGNSRPQNASTALSQFLQFFHREFLLFKQRSFITGQLSVFHKQREWSFPQWLLDVVVIPSLFALSIAMALPASKYQPHLAGFLCVLSVIWMAASQSHLALTTHWRRFRYETQQGLRPYSFITAKSTFLFIVTLIQTTLFFFVLWIMRRIFLNQPIFYGVKEDQSVTSAVQLGKIYFDKLDAHCWAVYLTLILVGFAASQLGLLISALAKDRTHVATSILPLLMIVQILFSPFVVKAQVSDQKLNETYRQFWHDAKCHGIEGCPANIQVPDPEHGLICEACRDAMESDSPHKGLSESDMNARRENHFSDGGPTRFATLGSYATLTRYADMALRPVISEGAWEVFNPDSRDSSVSYRFAFLRQRAMTNLVLIAIACHLLVTFLIGGFAFGSVRSLFRSWFGKRNLLPQAASKL